MNDTDYLDYLLPKPKRFDTVEDYWRSRSRQHEREMDRLHRETERQREIEHAIKLKQIGSGQGLAGIQGLARMVWKGTARDFGDWILKAHREGLIHAKSEMAALEQACQHFVRADGKALKARAIWQSLRNRRDEGK